MQAVTKVHEGLLKLTVHAQTNRLYELDSQVKNVNLPPYKEIKKLTFIRTIC